MKITLDSIVSGFKSVTKLISNFDKIEDDLNNKVLYRDNPEGEPNYMQNDLDMNSYNIINQGNPVEVSGFNWTGDWSSLTTYAVGDAVHSNGTAYIAIAASTNQTPPNGTYWQIVAEANYPTQTGNADKALTTDGSAASWGSIHADHVDFTNPGTGGVERTLQAKLEDVVNVKDFGAVGDGVTDDTAAIQAAIDYVIASGHVDILLPSDSTILTTTLTSAPLVRFWGNNTTFAAGNVYKVNNHEDRVGALTLPAAFSWFTSTISIASDGTGITDFDIESEKPTPNASAIFYVRPTVGNDSNAGTTYALPFRSIGKAFDAIAALGVDGEIILENTNFPRNDGVWGIKTLNSNVAISVLGDGQASIYGTNFSVSGEYALDGTYTNTYSRARTNVKEVRDALYTSPDGEYLQLINVASAADCNTTVNSWFSDGVTLYVRLIDDRAPDDDLLAFLETTCGVDDGAYKLWIKGVNFVGVQSVFVRTTTQGGGKPTFYGWKCSFRYNALKGPAGGGGFRTEGADSYLVECDASFNRYDGYNYHAFFTGGFFQTDLPNAFELDCTCNKNGWYNSGETPDYNDNGSTAHDGGSVIRLNTYTEENSGPNIVDVGAGVSSYNVNVVAKNTRKVGNSRNFEIQGAASEMYLVKCRSDGKRDYDATSDSLGTVYVYQSNIDITSGLSVSFQQYNI